MSEVMARKALFWGMLQAMHGQDVPLEKFVAANALILPKVGNDACRATLNQMQHDLSHLSDGLTVGRNSARLDHRRTVIEERTSYRPVTKSRLGQALWYVLFGVVSKGSPGPEVVAVNFTRTVKEKVADVRHKTLLTMLLDAGSTTGAVAAAFNRIEKVPLEINPKERCHLLRVNFLSNSIPLLAELCQGPHRTEVNLMVVGGDIRGERESICGAAAQVFLDQCSTGGDIAVVGVTGYGGMDGGQRAFFSDNLEEAQIKAAFFDRSLLRVLLFDSSKLKPRAPTRVFTRLSAECVDLVVTDDGHDHDGVGEAYVREVSDFLEHARENGVSVALVK